MAKGNTRYVPALDGLRALAVLSVIAYHMKADWAPGGLLGVTMFFVLSGYLITGLLLREYDKSGTISLKNFWVRRVRRIIPAVLFAVLGIALLCVIFDHALLTKMRPDVIPTLLFVNNWWQIFHNVSYFVALGEPSPLTHFWSLAIEEQFYLVWPIALLACLKLGVEKRTLERGTVALAVLSALEMAVLFDPSQDPSRVYYGTDTRAFSLLIGSALAFIWPYQRLSEQAGDQMTDSGKLVFNLVGVAALVGLLAMVAVTNGFEPFIYRGGLVLCSLLTAVAIAVMVHPVSWIGRLFQLAPLVWIGKVSYSMYLWHYPIILLMTPNNLVGGAPIWLRLIQLVIIFGISAFSYYAVENPIRHGAIGDFLGKLSRREFTLGQWMGAHVVPVVASAAFLVIPVAGLALVPDTSAVNNAALIEQEDGATPEPSPTETGPLLVPYDILLIGDSVPASMDGYGVFYEEFPYGHIDAVTGRQLYQAPELYSAYRDQGAVGPVVVFALGTNGYVQDYETEELMAEVGDEQRVWFVNTRSPEEYMETSNAAIQRCVDAHDNAELIDWYALSEQLGEDVFDGDGTHLTIDGCRSYADMIRDAVGDNLPKHAAGDKTRDELEQEARDALMQKARELADTIKGNR